MYGRTCGTGRPSTPAWMRNFLFVLILLFWKTAVWRQRMMLCAGVSEPDARIESQSPTWPQPIQSLVLRKFHKHRPSARELYLMPDSPALYLACLSK